MGSEMCIRDRAGGLLESADIVIVIGGASVGDRDFAKPMFAPHGLALVFDRLAIKPGKPVWLGRAGARLVLGLPGNPSSAMVTARLFLVPILERLQAARGIMPGATCRWPRRCLRRVTARPSPGRIGAKQASKY